MKMFARRVPYVPRFMVDPASMRRLAITFLLILVWAGKSHACSDEILLQGLIPKDLRLVDLISIADGKNDKFTTAVVELGTFLDAEGTANGTGGLVAFSASYLTKTLQQDKRTRYSKAVLNEEEELLGFLLASFDPRSEEVRIHKLGVLPKSRGLGLGTLMLAATAMRARKCEKKSISLNVFSSNLRAISLYETLGFERRSSAPSCKPPAFVNEMAVETSVLIGRSLHKP